MINQNEYFHSYNVHLESLGDTRKYLKNSKIVYIIILVYYILVIVERIGNTLQPEVKYGNRWHDL